MVPIAIILAISFLLDTPIAFVLALGGMFAPIS